MPSYQQSHGGILLIAAKTQKGGGSDFFKAAAPGVIILLLVRRLFSFAVVRQLQNVLILEREFYLHLNHPLGYWIDN